MYAHHVIEQLNDIEKTKKRVRSIRGNWIGGKENQRLKKAGNMRSNQKLKFSPRLPIIFVKPLSGQGGKHFLFANGWRATTKQGGSAYAYLPQHSRVKCLEKQHLDQHFDVKITRKAFHRS